MLEWLRKSKRASVQMPGGVWIRPIANSYDFPVVYLENTCFEPGAPRWLAFTAIISAKQGFPIAPAGVQPYTRATVIDAGGNSKEEAWAMLKMRLVDLYEHAENADLLKAFVQYRRRVSS